MRALTGPFAAASGAGGFGSRPRHAQAGRHAPLALLLELLARLHDLLGAHALLGRLVGSCCLQALLLGVLQRLELLLELLDPLVLLGDLEPLHDRVLGERAARGRLGLAALHRLLVRIVRPRNARAHCDPVLRAERALALLLAGRLPQGGVQRADDGTALVVRRSGRLGVLRVR